MSGGVAAGWLKSMTKPATFRRTAGVVVQYKPTFAGVVEHPAAPEETRSEIRTISGIPRLRTRWSPKAWAVPFPNKENRLVLANPRAQHHAAESQLIAQD
jgi:hypothetical protein